MSNPTNCRKCYRKFLSDLPMQADALSTAMREGEAAADLDLQEKLAEYHESHAEAKRD